MTTRAVVFDLGNVLIEVGHARAIDAFCRCCGAQADVLERALRDSKSLHRFERGELTRREFHEAFCAEVPLDIGFDEFCTVYCDVFAPVPQMIEASRAVRASGVATYLFSNTSELHLDHIRRQYPFVLAFDGHFLSYELGTMKPDESAYEAVESALGLPGAHLLYIDDRLENVEAGARRGWQVIHHTSAQATIARLRELKLL
jgi:2-haloacid dehalogenase